MAIPSALIKAIQSNEPTLTSIDLSTYFPSSEDIDQLIEALETNSKLRSIKCSTGRITDLHLRRLARIESLRHIECSIAWELLPETAQAIAESNIIELGIISTTIKKEAAACLVSSRKLQRLDISGHYFGGNGVIEALAQSTTLKELNISNNNLDDKNCAPLAKNKSILKLNINGNSNISDTGIKAIAGMKQLMSLSAQSISAKEKGFYALAKLPALKSLNIAHTKPTDNGFKYLACSQSIETLNICNTGLSNKHLPSFISNESLRDLDASYNKISSKGAKMIHYLSRIKRLDLDKNEIGDHGAECLSKMSNLRDLNIAQNPLTLNGIEHLARSKSLRKLNISQTEAKGDDCARLISENQTLLELKAERLDFSPKGIAMLLKNPNLQHLSVQFSDLGIEGAEAIKAHRNLKSVDLMGVGLTDELLAIVAQSTSVRRLDAVNNKIMSLDGFVKYNTTVEHAIFNRNCLNAFDSVKSILNHPRIESLQIYNTWLNDPDLRMSIENRLFENALNARKNYSFRFFDGYESEQKVNVPEELRFGI